MYSKTFQPKAADIVRKWHTVDAQDQVIGRLATQIARILQGKQKPIYSGHADVGDFVVVTNAAKLKITGKKSLQKIFFRHSGYPGGDRYESLGEKMAKKPEDVLMLAVKGMLPKNKLRAKFLKRLKIYKGVEQPHSAQNPQTMTI